MSLGWSPPLFATNFGPMAYAQGWVYGNRRDPSGAYNAYAIDITDTTRVRSLTAGRSVYGMADTHRGISDVSPDGRYMLVHAENPARWPPFVGNHSDMAVPGRGAFCDVWLATTDGLQAWSLTSIDGFDEIGTYWARFDSTGTRIVFAEIAHLPSWDEPLGGERLVVGRIVWTSSSGSGDPTELDRLTPMLVDVVELGDPHCYHEPYGFSADGLSVVASTDEHAPGHPIDRQQIHLFPLDGTDPVRLTSALGDEYQEFAIERPDHTGWVISSGYKGWWHGTDRWWVSTDDPSNAKRVTRFSDWTTWWPQMGLSGGMTFVGDDRAVVGYTKRGVENAYLIGVPR